MSARSIPQTQRPGASSSRVLWIQIVASKSGGEPHTVRCFEGGLITCDCQGYGWGGKCSHQATGKLQEAREALALAQAATPAPELPAAPYIRQERRKEAWLPTSRPTISYDQAMSDLFGN